MQHQKCNVIGCCHYDGQRVSTKLQTRPPSSVDADTPDISGVKVKLNKLKNNQKSYIHLYTYIHIYLPHISNKNSPGTESALHIVADSSESLMTELNIISMNIIRTRQLSTKSLNKDIVYIDCD